MGNRGQRTRNPNRAKALKLFVFEGMPVRKIGPVLDETEKTIMGWHARDGWSELRSRHEREVEPFFQAALREKRAACDAATLLWRSIDKASLESATAEQRARAGLLAATAAVECKELGDTLRAARAVLEILAPATIKDDPIK